MSSRGLRLSLLLPDIVAGFKQFLCLLRVYSMDLMDQLEEIAVLTRRERHRAFRARQCLEQTAIVLFVEDRIQDRGQRRVGDPLRDVFIVF